MAESAYSHSVDPSSFALLGRSPPLQLLDLCVGFGLRCDCSDSSASLAVSVAPAFYDATYATDARSANDSLHREARGRSSHLLGATRTAEHRIRDRSARWT